MLRELQRGIAIRSFPGAAEPQSQRKLGVNQSTFCRWRQNHDPTNVRGWHAIMQRAMTDYP
jgi:hypothetical protein